MLKGKKGDLSDYIMIPAILFFLAVAFITVGFVTDKFTEVIEETALNETDQASGIIEGLNTMTSTTIQRGFILLFAFLIIGTIASSFLVRVHPVFFFIYFACAGIGLFLSIIIANAYGIFADTTALQSIISQQTMITWVMQHLLTIMIGVIALSMIVLFAKLPSRNEPI